MINDDTREFTKTAIFSCSNCGKEESANNVLLTIQELKAIRRAITTGKKHTRKHRAVYCMCSHLMVAHEILVVDVVGVKE